jgi:putative flippase GtrA
VHPAKAERVTARAQTAHQFLRFALIGAAGFVVDSAALMAAITFGGLDRYTARLVSWFVAATFTWACNRRFTFSDTRPPLRQWLAFLAANAVGGAVNYAVYAALVTAIDTFARQPVLGVAAGAVAGLFFNFVASKWVVFRRERHHTS